MVKEVIWTANARQELFDILELFYPENILKTRTIMLSRKA
jgi:hypothetical protein